MQDLVLNLRSAPELRNASRGTEFNHPNSVRTWRASPETVAVQIRLGSRYVTAQLTFDQAIEFGKTIIANAEGKR